MTYPPNWPRCLICGNPALDAGFTCGAQACYAEAIRKGLIYERDQTPEEETEAEAAIEKMKESNDLFIDLDDLYIDDYPCNS